MLKLSVPTALVCHDAGATNIIIGWLKASAGTAPLQAFMQGPAAQLWNTAFPEHPICGSLDEALEGAQTLLSGTGWASELEHKARQVAFSRGVYNVAVLDHWVNYFQRFERAGQVQLPDEVWVADPYALELAQSHLPGLPVRQFDNLYLNAQVASVGEAPGNGTILVVLEPVRNTWGKDREGEFQALDYIFDHIDKLWPEDVTRVLLRQHPSEPLDKYQAWLVRHSVVHMDSSRDVAAAISQADLVVGLESFALTIALAAGRPVFSGLPPWAPALRLPQKGIQQIRHMKLYS